MRHATKNLSLQAARRTFDHQMMVLDSYVGFSHGPIQGLCWLVAPLTAWDAFADYRFLEKDQRLRLRRDQPRFCNDYTSLHRDYSRTVV